jgi:hypothetical protein
VVASEEKKMSGMGVRALMCDTHLEESVSTKVVSLGWGWVLGGLRRARTSTRETAWWPRRVERMLEPFFFCVEDC